MVSYREQWWAIESHGGSFECGALEKLESQMENMNRHPENPNEKIVQHCENITEHETCWKMNIYLQKSAWTQARTTLPLKLDEIGNIWWNLANLGNNYFPKFAKQCQDVHQKVAGACSKRAQPKSPSSTRPVFIKKIFCDLRSRWMTCLKSSERITLNYKNIIT